MGCSSGGGLGGLFGPMFSTQKTDVDRDSDNKPGFPDFLIGLVLIGPALSVVWFMGLFLWAHIGLIAPSAIIGLGFWSYACYRTKHGSMFRRRYRVTDAQRITIKRRLSGVKNLEKNNYRA